MNLLECIRRPAKLEICKQVVRALAAFGIYECGYVFGTCMITTSIKGASYTCQ